MAKGASGALGAAFIARGSTGGSPCALLLGNILRPLFGFNSCSCLGGVLAPSQLAATGPAKMCPHCHPTARLPPPSLPCPAFKFSASKDH